MHYNLRRKICFALLLTVHAIIGEQGTAVAQKLVFDRNFKGIECTGQVPGDLRKSLETLYMEDKQRVSDYTGGKLSNQDKVLRSSYYITRLMTSGRILYGDPITSMLNRIVDTLLIDQHELRKELRIYTVKSNDVNAFATGQGMIFVNLGLVAQVQDEAQLAFVLSHEITHYVQKHNLETLSQKIDTHDTTENGLNNFLRYHSRSREMENEADSLGIILFYANSPYDKHVCESFFDVLQYSYLPFDEIEFDTSQFSTDWFKPSNGTFLEKVNPISAREDYNDSLSTHPNLLKRRVSTSRILEHMQGGQHYVVTTEKEFSELQTLARLECIRQDIIHAEYASAYYNCYVMLKQQPDNEYLILAKAQALYGASKFRTYTAASNVTNYRDKEGSVQQAYHFMRRSRPAELCMIAIRELWKTRQKLNGDSRVDNMLSDLMFDLASKHKFRTDQFATTTDTTINIIDTSSSNNPKYNNVKRRRSQQQNSETYRFAFADIMQNDPLFQPMLELSMKGRIALKNNDSESVSNGSAFLYPSNYYVLNAKKEELKINKSVNGKNTLSNALKSAADAMDYGTIDFSDIASLNSDNSSSYNDFMTLNEWTNEFWQTGGNVPIYFSTQPSMNSLMKKYNADKIALSGAVNLEHTKKTINPLTITLGVSLLVTVPPLIYGIIAHRETTDLRLLLVDSKTGRILENSHSVVNSADSKAFLNSQSYASFLNNMNPKKNPGYLGKHFIVTLNGGLSIPAINRFFRDDSDIIAFRVGAEMEFAIKKQSGLALSADWGKMTFMLDNEPNTNATIGTYAITYRHYGGDNIAPLGLYYGGGLSLANVILNPAQGETLTYLDKSSFVPGLQFDLGRNYIFKNRIVLNIGAKYNITLANPISAIDFGWNNEVSHTNAKRSFNANLWMYNLLALKIAIGFLPF